MTALPDAAPGSPVSLAAVRTHAVSLGVAADLIAPDTTLDDLVAAAGEGVFALLVLYLDAAVPEPFPADLLTQVTTLGELLAFAEVKYSRAGPAASQGGRGDNVLSAGQPDPF